MPSNLRIWLRQSLHAAIGCTALTCLAEPCLADEVPPPATEESAPAAVVTMTLGQCIQMALERNPTLIAQRASVASAHKSLESLNNLSLAANLLAPDLKIRKQQAMLGIQAAEAQLMQAEQDVVFAVTRLYYTAVYASSLIADRPGEEILQNSSAPVLKEALDQLKKAQDAVKSFIQSDPKVTVAQRAAIELAMAELELRIQQAVQGKKLAINALREAMGQPCDFRFELADAQLPQMQLSITREQVIQLALQRRGELAQASVGADVGRLEIMAQKKRFFSRSVNTFASGGDIHSRPIPLGNLDGEPYRPSAVGPEMPVQLTGRRNDRMDRAAILSSRADAVVDKTRNLIILEAEAAYEKLVRIEASLQVIQSTSEVRKEGYGYLQKIFNIRPTDLVSIDNMRLINQIILERAKEQELRLEHLVAIANLQRVTAGGVMANFPGK